MNAHNNDFCIVFPICPLQAAERLIEKLLLPTDLVGRDKAVKLKSMIETFNSERGNFWRKTAKFDKDHSMWLMTSDDLQESYRWHQLYTRNRSKVLGRLACFVHSKILGTGSAERMFKIQKLLSRGQRAGLANKRSRKQGLAYAHYLDEISNKGRQAKHDWSSVE